MLEIKCNSYGTTIEAVFKIVKNIKYSLQSYTTEKTQKQNYVKNRETTIKINFNSKALIITFPIFLETKINVSFIYVCPEFVSVNSSLNRSLSVMKICNY